MTTRVIVKNPDESDRLVIVTPVNAGSLAGMGTQTVVGPGTEQVFWVHSGQDLHIVEGDAHIRPSPPPVDNEHVAPGCEPFDEETIAANAPPKADS